MSAPSAVQTPSRPKMDTKTMVSIAMLTGIAYIVMLLSKLMPSVMFLDFDFKDVVVCIGGFTFGPFAAAIISILVAFIEMLTISHTGPIGFIMNVLATCAFSCTACFIYKKVHSKKGAVLGLACGVACLVAVMLLWNYLITRMRRIPGHGTDIELLERCNDLCRHLCSQVPPLEDAQSLVSALERGYPRYSSHQVLMGYGLAPAFFTLLFGGHFLDGLCAFVCGLAVGICLLYGGRFIGSNSFFRTVVCSTVGSLLSLLLVRLGFGYDVDTVTIGVLMVLVPGVALTNAMREIMAGDIISGLSRTADAILVASAIALGTVVGLAIGQML